MNLQQLAQRPVLSDGGASTQIQALRTFSELLSHALVLRMREHPKKLRDSHKMMKLVNGHSMTGFQMFSLNISFFQQVRSVFAGLKSFLMR